ncbi:MAG: hypothetical protein AB7V06_16430 [Candidatus Obscuribacterales bacterium]
MQQHTKVNRQIALRIRDAVRAASEVFCVSENLHSSAIDRVSEGLYPSLSELLYCSRILDEDDHEFVSWEGSDELLNRADSSAKSTTLDPDDIAVVRHDLRLIYLLVEDLAYYLHQPGHWETRGDILQFADSIQGRIRDALERILPNWLDQEA